jgi:hypothetical protein
MNPSFLPILSERNALWIPACAGMTDWFVSNSPSFEGVARSDGVVAASANDYPALWAPLQMKGNFLPLVFVPHFEKGGLGGI